MSHAPKVLKNAPFVLTPACPNSAHLPLSFVVEKGRRRRPKHRLDEAVFFSFVLTLPAGLLTKTLQLNEKFSTNSSFTAPLSSQCSRQNTFSLFTGYPAYSLQ